MLFWLTSTKLFQRFVAPLYNPFASKKIPENPRKSKTSSENTSVLQKSTVCYPPKRANASLASTEPYQPYISTNTANLFARRTRHVRNKKNIELEKYRAHLAESITNGPYFKSHFIFGQHQQKQNNKKSSSQLVSW